MCVHSDMNMLSVLDYAVNVLKVKHIVVAGHYGCGGVEAALSNRRFGLIDNWLRHVQHVRDKHAAILAQLEDDHQRLRRLCELNVIEQVVNVCQTTIVQEAWQRGQTLAVHGWIYGVADGLLRELGITVHQPSMLAQQYNHAIDMLSQP